MNDNDDFRIITADQAVFCTCAAIVLAALLGAFA